MSRDLVVGYRVLPAGSGMRVWTDGAVELNAAGEGWRGICELDAAAVARIAERTRAAGIPELPSDVPAPRGFHDGNDCEWTTDLGGHRAVGLIRGWFDGNVAATASRALVLELAELVGAAQAR